MCNVKLKLKLSSHLNPYMLSSQFKCAGAKLLVFIVFLGRCDNIVT